MPEINICIAWAPDGMIRHDEGGFEPAGYVIWLADYPEEGVMPLDGGNPRPYKAISPPLLPQGLEPLSEEQIAAAWKAWPHQAITSAAKAITFVRSLGIGSKDVKEQQG